MMPVSQPPICKTPGLTPLWPTSLALALALACSSVSAKSVREVVQHTVLTNPDITVVKNRYLAERELIRQAKAGYLPTADVTAGIGREWTDSTGTRAAGFNNGRDLTRRELGVAVTQNLFDGFLTTHEVARHQAMARATAHKINGDAEVVALQAVRVYINLLRNQRAVSIANQGLATHRQIQDQIRLRSESGVGSRADLDQIDTRVALAENNVVNAKVNFLDAQTSYLKTVGELPGKLSRVPSIRKQLPDSMNEAVRWTLERNPTLKSAFADVDEATEQFRSASYNMYPRLDLELSANNQEDTDGTRGYTDDAAAMLRMRWNIYNGGKDMARKRETAHMINEAKEIRNRTHRQAEEAVRLSWAAYEATRRQISLLQMQVNSGIKTRDAYKEQFRVGDRTLLDILNTENDLLKAREDLTNAQMDNLLAQYRIASDIGMLLEVMNISLYTDEKHLPEHPKAIDIPDYTDDIYPKNEYMDVVKKHHMKVIGSPYYREQDDGK
jgi:adhesin transport system outer membrane protein